jgi:UDP-GlcNAc3NAcA epimerase
LFETISKIDKKIVIHIHPRTIKLINQYRTKIAENISMINPIAFMDMIVLEQNAKMIITDSGGIQKEAFFHKVPCLIFRPETDVD